MLAGLGVARASCRIKRKGHGGLSSCRSMVGCVRPPRRHARRAHGRKARTRADFDIALRRGSEEDQRISITRASARSLMLITQPQLVPAVVCDKMESRDSSFAALVCCTR